MNRIRVAQLGCGGRGKDHLDGWLSNTDRFEIVALCELDEEKMKNAAKERGISPSFYTDAGRMLSEEEPDLFCFCTQPDVRLEMIELAAENGIGAVAFEKPMAQKLSVARRITEMCRKKGIKATVCHQQKYLTSMQKLKETVQSGDIGTITEIHASSTCNTTDLGTHYTDYTLWANDFSAPMWVVAHVHGREQLDHSHPSPDFFLARTEFANGVRGLLEFGKLAPIYEPGQEIWQVNRLTVFGTHGYVWAETTGIWGAVTKLSGGNVRRGAGPGYTAENPGKGWSAQVKSIQTLYAADVADWLEGKITDHPCNVAHAFTGFELLNAACISALNHTRVDLPLNGSFRDSDAFEDMRRLLPECAPRIPRSRSKNA